MRNFNDAGTVHFDAETAELPVEVFIVGKCHGVEVRVGVMIPLKIKKTLKAEHFHQAELIIGRDYIFHMNKAIAAGVYPFLLKEATIFSLRMALCEFLYSQFVLEQNKRGNDVWAAPPTMQEIGPKPEDDLKFLN